MFACGTEIKTADDFFLRCPFYSTQRLELFKNRKKVNSNFFNLNEKKKTKLILYYMVLKQMILNILIKKFLNL